MEATASLSTVGRQTRGTGYIVYPCSSARISIKICIITMINLVIVPMATRQQDDDGAKPRCIGTTQKRMMKMTKCLHSEIGFTAAAAIIVQNLVAQLASRCWAGRRIWGVQFSCSPPLWKWRNESQWDTRTIRYMVVAIWIVASTIVTRISIAKSTKKTTTTTTTATITTTTTTTTQRNAI